MNEDVCTLSATKLWPNKFQRRIGYVDIAGHSSARWSNITIQWAKMAILKLYTRKISQTVIRPCLLLTINRKSHMV